MDADAGLKMRGLAAVSVTAILLAGCASTVPDDALRVASSALPGVELAAWAEPGADRDVIRGVLENGRPDAISLRYGEWPRPWNVTVTGPDGAVEVSEKEVFRDFFFGFLGPGDEESFRFTWLRQVYVDGRAEAAPAGPYTFHLAIDVYDVRGNAFAETLAVDVLVVVDPGAGTDS